MKIRITQRNIIFKKVQNDEFSVRSRWTKIGDIDFEPPKISLDEFHLLFFVTYQIKQVRTYAEVHVDTDDDFIVEIDNSIDDIILCGIQSQYSRTNRYKTCIQYLLTDDPIRAWYWQCQCKADGRRARCCAHIAGVI